jgi:signal transduction histidine kinase
MAHSRFATALGPAMLAGAALAVTWAVAALLSVDHGAGLETTYAAALPAARVSDITAGLGLLAAGALAATQPRTRHLGVLALLAALAWVGADWEGAESARPILRSLGAVVTPLAPVFVFHMALTVPDGRVRASAARVAIAAAYVVVGCLTVARALLRDPLLDLDCWRNCTDNIFLIHGDPGIASALDRMLLWSAFAIGLGLIGFAWRRLVGATGPGRRAVLPIIGPALLVGACEATYAVALLRTPLENPDRTGFGAIFIGRSLSYTLLALGLAWTVLRMSRTQARLTRLANDLGEAPRPGMLRDTLAAALGDPGIDVLYQRRGSEQLIDADGHAAAPPDADRAVATITRGDRPLALVLHDPALVNEPELGRALGSAATLAVENEALRAEAMAQLHALQASRTRVVEAGDATRRALERDLHDGAQQRLLALSYDLRLARAGVKDDGRTALPSTLDAAADEIEAALEELRDLAHGIYPAILTEAGLGPALATLADAAPLPVELSNPPTNRPPLGVERTAYVIVDDAIDDAAARGATWLAVKVRHDADRLSVATDDDGTPRSARLVHLADRVGALGGSLEVGATTLRAEIPCA